MMIFPLSIPAKIVLILICMFIGMIFSMMQWPEFWKRRFRQDRPSKLLKALDTFQAAKERKKLRKAKR
jgi:hypothetical protein